MPTDPAVPPVSVIQQVPIVQIRSSRHQARKVFKEEGLKSLAESIRLEGLIQPITVRRLTPAVPSAGGDEGALYELVSGERRLLAVKLLGLPTIEAKIVQPISEGEAAAKGLIENLQREDLNPIEEAEGFAEQNRLDPSYWTHEQIAKATGRSRSYITQSLGFINLLPKIRDYVSRLTLSRSHALEIMRLPSERQEKAAELMVKGKLSREKARNLVDGMLNKVAGKDAPSKEPILGLKKDPAALLWPELKMDLRMESAGAWTVDFKKGKWFFMVDSAGVGTQEALATWFLQVGKALGKPIPVPTEESDPPDVPETTDDSDGMMAMQKRAKLPKSTEEEAELYALAASSPGPGPIYARIYGPTNPFTRLAEGKTWADFQVTDPKEALRQLLDGIRKAQETKP